MSEFDQNGSQVARYDRAGAEPVRLDWNKVTSSPAEPVTTSGLVEHFNQNLYK